MEYYSVTAHEKLRKDKFLKRKPQIKIKMKNNDITSSKLKYILSHLFNIRPVNISQPSSLKNKQT